jgi:DNA mismatch repair protein MutS2
MQSREARVILSLNRDINTNGAYDICQDVKLAAKGKILEPIKLIEIQQTLSITRETRSNLKEISKEVESIWNIAKNIESLTNIEKDISRCISIKGDLLDQASSNLKAIRAQMKETRGTLLKRLESMLTTPRGRKIIQEPIIVERHGRYVIPVKVEFRRQIKGITHDVSNTGNSIYVEPWLTIDQGNKLRELQTEEKNEIERILRKLSTTVGEKETEILQNVSRLAELDMIMAKARYAYSVKAVEPCLINPSSDAGQRSSSVFMKLVDARHPLIGSKAVPLSVEIGKDYSTLIITGPNTGGKTVALKTIGLLSLMTQAGIPIPVSPETQIPVFEGIFADIGDEQSIEQTLSSFSWHIGNIVRIIENANKRSLVLFDELGTSTDPAEGSALARAILLHFLSSKTITVATTHFADLKAFAHATAGIQNASFDFDPASLAPTYHMTIGIAGGSNAMAAAARLGIPPTIIEKAKTMLPQGAIDLESMLNDIATEKANVIEMKIHMEREKSEAQARNTEVENLLAKIRSEEQRLIQEARDKVVLSVGDLHRQIRQASLDLHKQRSREAINTAKKSLANVSTRLNDELQSPKVKKKKSKEAIVVGDIVYINKFDIYGKVLSINEKKQEVEIQAGQITLNLKADTVEKAESRAGIRLEVKSKVVLPESRPIQSKLDLRGKRADEIEILLDGYLNDATLANLSEVQIIHGIGTGVVLQIVRDFLAGHPLVKSFSSGSKDQGGGGVTMVCL